MEDIDKEIAELRKEYSDLIYSDKNPLVKDIMGDHIQTKISMLQDLKRKIIAIRVNNKIIEHKCRIQSEHETNMLAIEHGNWKEETKPSFIKRIKKYFTLY